MSAGRDPDVPPRAATGTEPGSALRQGDGDDPPLSPREQQMMAYVDDEMSLVERAEFERVMAADEVLAMETVRYRNLLDMSHSLKMQEPSDHEVRRFWSRFYNRTEWRLGWILLVAGAAVLAAHGMYLLLTTGAVSWLVKGSVLSLLVGGGLLIWNTWRLKLRTSRFDRYRGVTR